MERITVGEILKPQGVRGEIKVRPITDDVGRFSDLKEVIIEDKTYRVLKSRIDRDFVYLALSGVADRNRAEELRGKMLEVDRENAVKLEEGNYFIVDILGCLVVGESGEVYGEVSDVRQGKVDVYTLAATGGKEIMFPFLKELIVSVDTDKKRIVVKEERFKEVAVYED